MQSAAREVELEAVLELGRRERAVHVDVHLASLVHEEAARRDDGHVVRGRRLLDDLLLEQMATDSSAEKCVPESRSARSAAPVQGSASGPGRSTAAAGVQRAKTCDALTSNDAQPALASSSKKACCDAASSRLCACVAASSSDTSLAVLRKGRGARSSERARARGRMPRERARAHLLGVHLSSEATVELEARPRSAVQGRTSSSSRVDRDTAIVPGGHASTVVAESADARPAARARTDRRGLSRC